MHNMLRKYDFLRERSVLRLKKLQVPTLVLKNLVSYEREAATAAEKNASPQKLKKTQERGKPTCVMTSSYLDDLFKVIFKKAIGYYSSIKCI